MLKFHPSLCCLLLTDICVSWSVCVVCVCVCDIVCGLCDIVCVCGLCDVVCGLCVRMLPNDSRASSLLRGSASRKLATDPDIVCGLCDTVCGLCDIVCGVCDTLCVVCVSECCPMTVVRRLSSVALPVVSWSQTVTCT